MKFLSKNKKKFVTQELRKNQDFIEKVAKIDQSESLKLLQNKTLGLRYDEVIANRNKYGKNKVDHQRFVIIKKILKVLLSPFNLILFGLLIFGIFEYAFLSDEKETSDLIKNIIIAIMIVISITLTLFQDIRSWYSTKKLQEMIEVTASVYRYDAQHAVELSTLSIDQIARNTSELPIDELVPGDIIFLSSGDMVPADVHILMSTDLFTNEATITGESLPVEKHAYKSELVANQKLPVESVAFMGSSVVSGSAVALVVRTGRKTFFGNIASALTTAKVDTSFDRGIRNVTLVLIAFMAVVIPALFVLKSSLGIDAWTIGAVIEALKWTLAIAVALTPEMLPMVVTANLARGALKMAKNKVIVKNLNVMQSLGAMDILCTDKTGTLTEDEIELIKFLDLSGQTSEQVLKYGYLNSYHQTGLRNNIDKTIIAHTMNDFNHITTSFYQKIDEIPFDFARRRMSVVVKGDQANNLLITKGAVEEILKISQSALIGNKIVPMTKEIARNVLNLSQKMNSEGLRVIAIAIRNFDITKQTYRIDDENDLVLIGYLGFQDVAKESAIKAINSLRNRGVDVKILTGDNEIVTKAICKQVGLETATPLLGEDIDQLSDARLEKIALKTTIFAKVNPLQKARIVTVLKNSKKTIGFLGDGINDAVALKIADVGISVDSATDIAKEASDIIMLEKSLTVLEHGVIGGRKTFMNIIKYIKTTFASNFGNAFSMIIAVAWFPLFAPMMALQILMQNLLYDVSQLATPWDKVDSELIQKPREWDARSFVPFALWNGPVSSIFDVATFALMGLFYGVFAAVHADPSIELESTKQALILFQSGWFIVGTTTQILIAHLVRTPKVPFIQSSASKPVYLVSGILLAFAIALPSIPVLNSWFSFAPLPASYYGFLFLFLALYFMTNQLVKVLYKRIHKRWL